MKKHGQALRQTPCTIAPDLPSLHSKRRKAYYHKPALGFAGSGRTQTGEVYQYSEDKAAAVTCVRSILYI